MMVICSLPLHSHKIRENSFIEKHSIHLQIIHSATTTQRLHKFQMFPQIMNELARNLTGSQIEALIYVGMAACFFIVSIIILCCRFATKKHGEEDSDPDDCEGGGN